MSPDGHRLYFSRFINHDGNSNYDLDVSRRHNKKDAFGWEPALPVDELNTTGSNDVALDFFEDDATGRLIAYFTSNRLGDAALFLTWLQDDDTFATPPALVDDLNATENHERLATIRRDGLEVFFNRAPVDVVPGPVIQTIFTSTRPNTGAPWSEPIPVPPPVGLDPTGGYNIAPRLSFDGTELYFSSTRGGGSGGNDIWVSTRTKLKGN